MIKVIGRILPQPVPYPLSSVTESACSCLVSTQAVCPFPIFPPDPFSTRTQRPSILFSLQDQPQAWAVPGKAPAGLRCPAVAEPAREAAGTGSLENRSAPALSCAYMRRNRSISGPETQVPHRSLN